MNKITAYAFAYVGVALFFLKVNEFIIKSLYVEEFPYSSHFFLI